MAFQLPPLPFDQSSLSPTMSKETFEYHYGKHHKAYIDNLNKLLETSPMKDASLEEIVRKSEGGMFNNSAQSWNHTFFWHCMTPNAGDKKMSGALEGAIKNAFGSTDAFLKEFIAKATGNFGSGWTWLVKDGAGKVSIANTSNAGTPLTAGQIPLLTVDVWEHAYYIDYRNARAKYLESFPSIVNWKFASSCYDSAEPFNATKIMRS